MVRLAALLAACMVLAGCGGVKPKLEQVSRPAAVPVEKPAPPADEQSQPEPEMPAPEKTPGAESPAGEEATVWAKAQVLTAAPSAGKRVEFLYEYSNLGGRPITLSFNTGQTVELVVEQAGREIWRFSRKGVFTQQLIAFRLGAGESKAWRLAWDGRDMNGRPVPPGRYTARLSLESTAAMQSVVAVEFDVS